VDRYYREHYRQMMKFLQSLQIVLVVDPPTARADAVLAPTALIASQSTSAW
jgi:hypothetical protein